MDHLPISATFDEYFETVDFCEFLRTWVKLALREPEVEVARSGVIANAPASPTVRRLLPGSHRESFELWLAFASGSCCPAFGDALS